MARRPPYTRRQEPPKSKKQPMLNVRKEVEFRYDLRKILEGAKVDEKIIPSFIATLFSKGSRINLYDAKEYVENKLEEGIFDNDTMERILHLMSRYKRWR